MKKNIFDFVICSVLLALCSVAEAQPETKIFRIGYLDATPSGSAPFMEAFRQSMAKLGWIEGKNIAIEYRFLDGRRDAELAEELVRSRVDVIVAAGGASPARAAKGATEIIPIVMTTASDPVAQGFVASLAKPGGNITGFSTFAPEVGGKRLELLKEAVPKLARVAVLYNPATASGVLELKEDLPVAARALGLTIQAWEVRGSDDFESVFATMGKERPDGLYVTSSPLFTINRKRIAGLALRSRLPSVYSQEQYLEAGGLMYYGADDVERYRRVAYYVDKILQGAKPADLPVEQPTKFRLVINLKTAKQIGLTIPPNVLARADQVIK